MPLKYFVRILIVGSVRYSTCDGMDPYIGLSLTILGIVVWKLCQTSPEDYTGHKESASNVFSILRTFVEEPVNTVTILFRELCKWL
jgi:hypothetical protein